jgi:hypothetical protein
MRKGSVTRLMDPPLKQEGYESSKMRSNLAVAAVGERNRNNKMLWGVLMM